MSELPEQSKHRMNYPEKAAPVVKPIFFFTLAVVFIVGLATGFGSGRFLSQPQEPTTTQQQAPATTPPPPVVPEGARISPDLLMSPVLFNWSGKVNGEVVEKTENFFTLAKDGDTLTLEYIPGQTSFRRLEMVGDASLGEFKFVDVAFADIVPGTVLAGPVAIGRPGAGARLVASVMSIQ